MYVVLCVIVSVLVMDCNAVGNAMCVDPSLNIMPLHGWRDSSVKVCVCVYCLDED